MGETETNQLERSMEFNVVQETVNGILAAKTNRKLKKSLYQLKNMGELYKNGHFMAFFLKGINRDKHRIKGYIYDSSKRIWNLQHSVYQMQSSIKSP